MNAKALSDTRRKLRILEYGKQVRNVSRPTGTSESPEKPTTNGNVIMSGTAKKALVNLKPCPKIPKLRVPKHIEELIIHLRTN